MIMQNKDIGKIIVYVLGTLTVLSTGFIVVTMPGYEKLWGILPFTLGSAILLLNRFKKIN